MILKQTQKKDIHVTEHIENANNITLSLLHYNVTEIGKINFFDIETPKSSQDSVNSSQYSINSETNES